MPKLKIAFFSYECAPFIKRGGLGDVALGLPKALTKLGVDCRLIIPKYKAIDDKKHKLKLVKKNIPVQLKNKIDHIDLYESRLPKSKTPVYFIDHRFFRLNNVFGYKNDRERFFFYCQASLDVVKNINFKADVLHCNDWHTGLIPLMLKKKAIGDDFFQNIKTVYTIHNLAYQGKAGMSSFKNLDLCASDFYNTEQIEGVPARCKVNIKDYGVETSSDTCKVNAMAQGINDADLVGTVSKTYAKEILTKEYGAGLENILNIKKKQNKLFGIVNGLDYVVFNPKTDGLIEQKYNYKSIKKKIKNKKYLQKFFGLPENENIPVVGIVSRLARQKGLDILSDFLMNSKTMDYQLVVLGDGEKKYEECLKKLMKKYPKNIGAKIMFSVDLASDIYAGADMFLMPSRYEPCGLGQLIAMRYGTVPIVRQTGGLKDTVKNYLNKSSSKATGFVFKKYDWQTLGKTINRAVKIYDDKKTWDRLVKNCMNEDFSWEYSAKEYILIYNKINTKK